MQSGTWTWFDHTADLGIEVSAPSIETLFSTAATALFDLLVETDPTSQAPTLSEHSISLHAGDLPELLVRWLAELLYLHETIGLVFKGLKVSRISDELLIGVVHWEPLDPARHRVNREIKAVTYHQIVAERDSTGWRARVIFDV